MHIGAPFYMIQFEVLVVSRCDGYLFSCVHLFFSDPTKVVLKFQICSRVMHQ
jgi:hypothetical protein